MDIIAWVSQQDAKALVIGCGVLAAAIAAVFALFRVVLVTPLSWAIRHALDDWATERIDPRIDGIEAKVDEVRDQFRNNGGSTMRDRVDEVARVTGAKPPPDRQV